MREAERTGEFIRVRQAVTYTADGQTRTLEVEIPLRPGASPEEVEALLAQAEDGMARLALALDARIAAMLAPAPAPSAPARSAMAAPPAAPASLSHPAERAAAPAIAPAMTPGAREDAAPAPAAVSPTPPAPTPPAPTPPAPTPPAPAAARPTPPAQAPARGKASGPLAPPPPAVPASTAPTTTGPDISRQEFLAATNELGLNPKEAMDRLGVRSLAGLNLREALESLRRQALRAPASPAPSASAPAASAPAAREHATGERATYAEPARRPSPTPAYFDEEDGADITFAVGEDGEPPGGEGDEYAPLAGGTPPGEDPGAAYGAEVPDALDEFDLDDDVPDFGPPPGRASAPAAPARSPARAARPTGPTGPTGPTPAPEPAPRGLAATAARGAANSRAAQLLAQLRTAHAGATATSQQRTAYRNIIVAELGDPAARALVQGVWKATPERLGAEQYDELIRWGKQDTFSEEAKLVLAVLAAEREAAAREAEGAGDAPPAASTRARPGPARGNG